MEFIGPQKSRFWYVKVSPKLVLLRFTDIGREAFDEKRLATESEGIEKLRVVRILV